jgi:hypothetical protein
MFTWKVGGFKVYIIGGSDIGLATAICVDLDCTHWHCGHLMVRETGRIIICSRRGANVSVK